MKGIMAYPKLKVKSDRPLNPAAQQSFFSFSINIKFIVWNELYKPYWSKFDILQCTLSNYVG